MKKVILGALLLLSTLSFGQNIYKGLSFGMSPKDAKTEFKSNKENYKGIDIGNNFIYTIYHQNFMYDEDKLVSILLTPSGSTWGQSYNDVVNYLTYTKVFFDSLGYEIFLEQSWWKSPEMFNSTNSKYGLVLFNKEKTTIIQIYPISYMIGAQKVYLVKLHIYNYNWWMNSYNKENDKQTDIKKSSGF